MAYTYDLTQPVGMVRLTIGDEPDSQGIAFFTDAELQGLITAQDGNTGKASIQALRIWARRLASKPKQQIGDYTYDPAVTAKNLMAAAEALADELDDELDDPVVMELGGDFWVRS